MSFPSSNKGSREKFPAPTTYLITRRFQRIFEYARRFDREHVKKQPIFLRQYPEPWQDRQIQCFLFVSPPI